jgi:putative oxidoreductase
MNHLISATYASKWGDPALLFLRVAAGLIFFTHGWQKWQAGVDLTAAFLNTLSFPAPGVFALVLITIEVVGGLALIVGAYTRLAAKLTGLVAVVALLTVHVSKGYSAAGGGYEYVLLLIAACVVLLVMGGGKWSADRKFLKM